MSKISRKFRLVDSALIRFTAYLNQPAETRSASDTSNSATVLVTKFHIFLIFGTTAAQFISISSPELMRFTRPTISISARGLSITDSLSSAGTE
jgi:hypothetical protein